MKLLKKSLSVLVAVATLITLVGCGGNKDTSTGEKVFVFG